MVFLCLCSYEERKGEDMLMEFTCLDCHDKFTCQAEKHKCDKVHRANPQCLCKACYSKNFHIKEEHLSGCLATIKPVGTPHLDKVC